MEWVWGVDGVKTVTFCHRKSGCFVKQHFVKETCSSRTFRLSEVFFRVLKACFEFTVSLGGSVSLIRA